MELSYKNSNIMKVKRTKIKILKHQKSYSFQLKKKKQEIRTEEKLNKQDR